MAPRRLSGRGSWYRTDGKEERIACHAGDRLVALNAKTGMRMPTFGDDGSVDRAGASIKSIDPMSGGDRTQCDADRCGNIVVVGAHIDGVACDREGERERPHRGFDVRTGKAPGIFHTIPSPGESDRHVVERSAAATDYAGGGANQDPSQVGIAYLAIRKRDRWITSRHRRGNISSRKASSLSTCTPGSANGTSSSCITASGITTSRARRCS